MCDRRSDRIIEKDDGYTGRFHKPKVMIDKIIQEKQLRTDRREQMLLRKKYYDMIDVMRRIFIGLGEIVFLFFNQSTLLNLSDIRRRGLARPSFRTVCFDRHCLDKRPFFISP
jgi:hypothetical protein